MKATLNIKHVRPDGMLDTFQTLTVDAISKPLWWQEKGLSYTASGYGKRIPTQYMVQFNGKWRRVYCVICSNIGTCYIGDFFKRSGDVITIGDIA